MNEGSIYIDDIEIRTLNKNSLRQISDYPSRCIPV
ncbi:hypothetical protein NW739_05540 [Mycoplasmopsis felis]|nr:hypothetical protein [Mycoplasmopsis felis]MCU9940130.1 hypothetical protein [Mycoplasmopsis felis]